MPRQMGECACSLGGQSLYRGGVELRPDAPAAAPAAMDRSDHDFLRETEELQKSAEELKVMREKSAFEAQRAAGAASRRRARAGAGDGDSVERGGTPRAVERAEEAARAQGLLRAAARQHAEQAAERARKAPGRLAVQVQVKRKEPGVASPTAAQQGGGQGGSAAAAAAAIGGAAAVGEAAPSAAATELGGLLGDAYGSESESK